MLANASALALGGHHTRNATQGGSAAEDTTQHRMHNTEYIWWGALVCFSICYWCPQLLGLGYAFAG